MKTLVINTYGGSLLLGAKALGLEIIGSYEDVGFGMPIQKANFPGLDFREKRADWPTQDLSETFVIAHPPCSAFSVMTNRKEARGVDSAAFACTKSVLQYCVDNKAKGLAIESVVGAMAGAWPIHQYYADQYGYNLYRLLENGTMFGAQWRDRFWVVYIKKDAAPEKMPWRLTPRWSTVQKEIDGYEDGPAPYGMDAALDKIKGRFVNEAGCTPEDMEFIFGAHKEEMCSVDDRLWRRKFQDRDRWDVCKTYVTKFASGAMVILNPDSFCPVLLGGSWWFVNGRNLSEAGYKRLMGFPVDYVFPTEGNYHRDFRTYLSKGVMPPVATWVLENSLAHLGWKPSNDEYIHTSGVGSYTIEVEPNQIGDFRIRKKTWGESTPRLRHEDEARIAPRPAMDGIEGMEPYVEPEPLPVRTRARREPGPKPERVPRQRAVRVIRSPRAQTPWNSAIVEEAIKEKLYLRPHTADQYALYESHGYHKMGVKPGDTVLDIGAHIGCVASRAALVGAAKVISVEAEPENFELLKQNTQWYDNVMCVHAAVWGEPGDGQDIVKLNRVKKRNDEGHSTGTHSVFFKTQGDTIEVPRITFRDLIAEYKPNVIKCDIEGGEFSWNWDNLPEHVRSIGIEFHTKRDLNRPKAIAIHDTLIAQGFKPVNNINMQSNFSAIIAYFARPVTENTQPADVNSEPVSV